MTNSEPYANPPDADVERLVPLELWLRENVRMRSIWRFGSPQLHSPNDMSKWLRRHEKRLTEAGAVMRLGNAWPIIEPVFRPVPLEILTEEREAAAHSKGRK